MFRVADTTTFEIPQEEDVEVVEIVHQQLGIDEARNVTEQAFRRPLEKTSQLLLVRTTFITHEAQNALLKLLEEPPITSRFLFLVPMDMQLLPTLASRLVVETVSENDDNSQFNDFMNASIADRLSQIETATKVKDTEWMRAIKSGLLGYISKAHSAKEKQTIELVTRLLLTRGASNKMLLEHAALGISRPAKK